MEKDAILLFKPRMIEVVDILKVSAATVEVAIRKKSGMTFSQYRDLKMAGMKMNLARKQYEVALKGNIAMLIWLGKQYLGQSDHAQVNLTGGDGYNRVIILPDNDRQAPNIDDIETETIKEVGHEGEPDQCE